MNPILIDFPNRFETSRLLLRCPESGDGLLVHEAVVESIHSLQRWMSFVNPLPSKEKLEEFTRMSQARFILREDLQFYAFDKASQRFLGSIGLHKVNWKVRKFEIGYWLRDSATGQGYATEAVNALTAFAFHSLAANRLEIRCDPRNVASRKVAERCGYSLEAILVKSYVDPAGKPIDDCLYAKLRSEGD